MAADMAYPVKAAPAEVFVVPTFSWTGFYLGASVGYGWGEVGSSGDWANYLGDIYPGAATLNSTGSIEPEGWFGGGQIGYNYQMVNNVVIGVEADLFFADKNDSRSYSAFAPGIGLGAESYGAISAEIETFGTVRARLGYAFDRFMPYVTGGLAWANVKVRDQWADYNGGVLVSSGSSSRSETEWGWAIGGGMEYAFTDNWTAKVEYMYTDIGSVTWDRRSSSDFDVTSSTLKVGVNYKF